MSIPAFTPAAPQLQDRPVSPPPQQCGVSPFLSAPQTLSATTSPVVVHLRRDQNQAITLCLTETLQTRFGSFPHTSFIGLAPGSQVRASESFPTQRDLRKRKRQSTAAASAAAAAADAAADAAAEAATDTAPSESTIKSNPATTGTVAATSGFLHVLAPTPELWTASLPHRTQVVYTPDSSYILYWLGVVPGTQIIEAGAGSGSFTHAAAWAVYNGYPDGRDGLGLGLCGTARDADPAGAKEGKVWSFEFHEERAGKLCQEISHHGLDPLVTVTHKDVCTNGFLVPPPTDVAVHAGGDAEPVSPCATAVFLDLPAPWLALPQLSRCVPSALDPCAEVRLCTFSPCIEQVARTCAAMRAQGWVDITTVELAHQQVEVRRQLPRDSGGPCNIAEALARLKGVNEFREQRRDIQASLCPGQAASSTDLGFAAAAGNGGNGGSGGAGGRGQRRPGTPDAGKLLTRNEPELKTHTSFLTFATLPRQWTADQEQAAAQWVRERDSQGPAAMPRVVVGKTGRWKGNTAESRMARKERERAEREAARGQHLTGIEGVSAALAVQQQAPEQEQEQAPEEEQDQVPEQEQQE